MAYSRFLSLRSLCVVAAVSLALGCSKSSTTPTTPTPPATGTTSFSGNFGWTCATGVNCQDVFDFTVAAGSVLTVRVSNVEAGSASQIALYAPGTALGGTNLLTGTTKELRCTVAANCSLFTGGEQKVGITATQAGTYRLAVTRDRGVSCGATGTYRVELTSSIAFQTGVQSVQDQASLASGFECK